MDNAGTLQVYSIVPRTSAGVRILMDFGRICAHACVLASTLGWNLRNLIATTPVWQGYLEPNYCQRIWRAIKCHMILYLKNTRVYTSKKLDKLSRLSTIASRLHRFDVSHQMRRTQLFLVRSRHISIMILFVRFSFTQPWRIQMPLLASVLRMVA